MKSGARVIRLLVLGSLAFGLFAGYQIFTDPEMPGLWKAFVICAGAPTFVVLVFLIACMMRSIQGDSTADEPQPADEPKREVESRGKRQPAQKKDARAQTFREGVDARRRQQAYWLKRKADRHAGHLQKGRQM